MSIEIIPSTLKISKADDTSAYENYFDTYHPPSAVERICEEAHLKVLGNFKALKAPPLIAAGHNLFLCRKLK